MISTRDQLLSNTKFIVASDWDGTITTQDSNDAATDNLGFGSDKRKAINVEILNRTKHFRDGFQEMIDSVAEKVTFEEMKQYIVDNIKLDPGFSEFYYWCKENKIPVVVVSSGMEPIIRASLENFLGKEAAEDIEIIANGVEYRADGTWTIKFRHPESGFGHDKYQSTAAYRDLPQKPTLFFCGDGVSDLSAAKAANLLFVKVIPNNDLSIHCIREKIPFVAFDQFQQVLETVKSVVGGQKTVEELLK